MHQIGNPIGFNRVASLLQCRNSPGLGVFLTRKDQVDVTAFVLQLRSIRKGSPARYPTNVNATGWVSPHPARVKRLMAERLRHFAQLAFCVRWRTVSDKANDSGQFDSPRVIPASAGICVG